MMKINKNQKKEIHLNFSALLILVSLLFSQQAWTIVLKGQDKVPISLHRLKSIAQKIKKQQLVKSLHEFIRISRPGRLVGSEGHTAARNWIVQKLKELDTDNKATVIVDQFEPDLTGAIAQYQADFDIQVKGKFPPESKQYKEALSFTNNIINTMSKLKGIKGKNIIWEKRGAIDEEALVIVASNYDTVLQDGKTKRISIEGEMPGADDNASGVIVMLALAELLLELNTPKTVQLVFFDFQEFGALGSKAYVEKYGEDLKKNSKFLGMVNLLMLGNDTKSKDLEKKLGNMNAYIRRPKQKGYGADLKLSNELLYRGQKTSSNIDFELKKTGFDLSDNAPFWQAGLPAIVFTQNWESDLSGRHHTPNDFAETVNFNTLWASYRYLSGAVAGWSFDLVK